MRISHRHKFVFLAVPRTASNSVRAVLDPYSDVSSVHISETTPDFPFYNHIDARECRAAFRERDWDWDEYRAFCVTRNPFSRTVSLYHLWIRLEAEKPPRPRSLKQKLRDRIKGPPGPASFREWVLSRLGRPVLDKPVVDFVSDDEGTQIVDRVLRFEHLGTELPEYLATLGIDVTPEQVPRLNKLAPTGDYRERYDDETRARVEEVFRADLDRFGYSF